MRVSTNMIYGSSLSTFAQQNSKIAELREQVSSGKKILKASDDPSGSVRANELSQRRNSIDQYQRNIDFATSRVEQQETALRSAVEGVQRMRELAVQAGNGSYDQLALQNMAAEVVQTNQMLAGLANSRDANGEYLFSGVGGEVKPVHTHSTTVSELLSFRYDGAESVRQVQISETRQIDMGISGSTAFMSTGGGHALRTDVPSSNTGSLSATPAFIADPDQLVANAEYQVLFAAGGSSFDVVNTQSGATVLSAVTYQPGEVVEFDGIALQLSGAANAGDKVLISPGTHQDLFTAGNKFAYALENAAGDPSRMATLAGQALDDLDAVLNSLLEATALAGVQMRALDAEKSGNADEKLQVAKSLSEVEDVDMAEAISNLTKESNLLEAAQASFGRVSQLSLFRYL